MTKTYKINGKEIPQAGIWEDGKGNFRGMATEDVVNQLIEALADREGYCGWCDMGVTKSGHLKECPDYKPKQEDVFGYNVKIDEQMPKDTIRLEDKKGNSIEIKKSTSLKEEIIETIWTSHGQSTIVPNTTDKILSLIQSHLLKEIELLPKSKLIQKAGDYYACGYGDSRQDIIKIINNLTK